MLLLKYCSYSFLSELLLISKFKLQRNLTVDLLFCLPVWESQGVFEDTSKCSWGKEKEELRWSQYKQCLKSVQFSIIHYYYTCSVTLVLYILNELGLSLGHTRGELADGNWQYPSLFIVGLIPNKQASK